MSRFEATVVDPPSERGHYHDMRHLLRTLGPIVALLCLSYAAGEAHPPAASRETAAQGTAPAIRQVGRVTDAADIIPDDVEMRLAAKLAEFERRTMHQMVIVTLPTLAGRDVADVADELGNTWHVGRAGYNDGLVLLVAPNERRARISTADGVRRLIPDEVCRQIIDETMVPHLRAGDLPGGIEAGTDAVIAHLR